MSKEQLRREAARKKRLRVKIAKGTVAGLLVATSIVLFMLMQG